MNNPWKGVVPYTENDSHLFLGRKQEIEELFYIVKTNYISTLYGRSGIGKTSLLKVGLFPCLYKEYYYPISIRLNTECDGNMGFAKIITDCIKEELSVRPLNETVNIPEVSEGDINYLWNYFAYNGFYNKKSNAYIKENDEVVPVIVLDQFEEILRNSEDHEKALTLINQIHSTLQEGFLCDGTPYTIPFRFVISLREDDLYLLEDLLDEQYIDTMKRGRYRLRPMQKEAAKEVIFIKPELFDSNEIGNITDRIIKLSDQEGQISTLLLSLICFKIFESANGKTGLTVKNVDELIGEKPLDTFYQEAISGLDTQSLDWLEENFVKDDRRSPVSVKNIPETILEAIHNNKLDDEAFDHHILTISSKTTDESLELLHDKLAVAVAEYRKVRLEKEKVEAQRRKYRKRVGILIGVGLLVALFFFVRSMTNRSVEFSSLNIEPNQIIPNNKQYKFSDERLRLVKSRVLPNTFCNKDVRYLEIDSVTFLEGVALYLPNLDTLVLGGNDYDNKELFNDSIQSVKVLIAKRPIGNVKYSTYILRNLDTVLIDSEDDDVLRWHNGALYVRDKKDKENWYVKIKQSNEIPFYNNEVFQNCNVYGAERVIIYDIAAPPKEFEQNSSYKLCCSDPDHSYFRKVDVPKEIKNKIAIIELPYVDSIENNVFDHQRYNNNNKLESLICNNVSKIGDSAFIFCSKLKTIELPKVKNIGSYAFYANYKLKTIQLDSVKIIGNHAFNSINNLQKICLPVVDSIGPNAFSYVSRETKCYYNPRASIHSNSFYPIPDNLYGRAEDTIKSNGCGYHFEEVGQTISIDSFHVSRLEVGKDVRRIKCSNGVSNPIVDEVVLEKGNPYYFIWKKDLYEYNPSTDSVYIVIVSNREKYVSLSPKISRKLLVTKSLKENNKFQEFYAIYSTDLNEVKNNNIILWVPYKQRGKFFPWENSFADIREMKWISTLWYKAFYEYPHCLLNKKARLMGAETSDYLAVISCGIFMLALLIILNKLEVRKRVKWQWLIDIGMMLIIGTFVWFVVFITEPVKLYYNDSGVSFHSLEALFEYLRDNGLLGTRAMTGWKFSFSIWPIWCFAPEIWIIYLILTSKIKSRKE